MVRILVILFSRIRHLKQAMLYTQKTPSSGTATSGLPYKLLFPDFKPGISEDLTHFPVPFPVIRFTEGSDTGIPDRAKIWIFCMHMPVFHHSSCPFPLCIKDQESPASVFPADIRAGEMDCAIVQAVLVVVPEKGAGFRQAGKYLPVVIEMMERECDLHLVFLPGVLVPDEKGVIV
jgi:hypothetical protein